MDRMAYLAETMGLAERDNLKLGLTRFQNPTKVEDTFTNLCHDGIQLAVSRYVPMLMEMRRFNV